MGVPVEGGSCNDYDYGCGDPVNNYDLDGTRCLTGVAWKEQIRYQDKDGNWKTKTKEHCNSIAKGVKRNAEGAVRGAKCVAGQLAPWNYGESSLVEAGGAIGSAGSRQSRTRAEKRSRLGARGRWPPECP